MSELRDARLKKALESAPDAQLRPDARTRQAIRARAREAIASSQPDRWWRGLWRSSGRRLPWGAALATVAMATLVTLLWHDRDIPGARPDGPSMEAPVAAPSPSPTPAAPAAAPPRARRAESPALRDQSTRELAKSAPPAAASRSAPPTATAESARAAAAPAVGFAPQLRRQVADSATQLRVLGQGRAVDVPLEPSSRLADLLRRVTAASGSTEPLAAVPEMRVELRREGEAAGVLELAGPQVRWTPAGGGASGTARPDPAVLQALREEFERVLQR